ncbi:hypothetical protein [Gorillibacterium sp. sgz5001074]|uniref:hypothetical protein n=1 Tax=Gorillibacterium sp. sgz5001074 TaxID=3446695 RepID=UPI003F66A257
MHYDVLRTIQKDFFKRVDAGELLSTEDVIEYMQVGSAVMDAFEEKNEDLMKSYEEFLKWKRRREKILSGFLKLHKLEWDYANYLDRIERRLP